jgi:hypothetical protein
VRTYELLCGAVVKMGAVKLASKLTVSNLSLVPRLPVQTIGRGTPWNVERSKMPVIMSGELNTY